MAPYYKSETATLVAVDCIIFGYDEEGIKLLLIKRGFEPEKDKWSLMGGFLKPAESLDQAAHRILKQLTGMEGLYMEQLHSFSEIDRDPGARTISVAYFALINIHEYETQLSHLYKAEWFPLNKRPRLIFDHDDMVRCAQKQLRYKASQHPILFELLPERFTIPQLQNLFESLYESLLDNRNFTRKIMSTGLLIKLSGKDKSSSKKGAYYYKLDRRKYKLMKQSFLPLVPGMRGEK